MAWLPLNSDPGLADLETADLTRWRCAGLGRRGTSATHEAQTRSAVILDVLIAGRSNNRAGERLR